MGRRIGSVLSPGITEELLQRGRNRYAQGPAISRERVTRYHPSKEGGVSSSRREDRLTKEQELEEARALRGEGLAREQFEHKKEQDKLAFQRESRLADTSEESLEIQRGAQKIREMRDINTLLSTIGRLEVEKNKMNAMFEVPPGQQKAIGALLKAAYGQLESLLGPEKAQAILSRQSPQGGDIFDKVMAPFRQMQQDNPMGSVPPPRAGAGGAENPFAVADEEADDELDDLVVPGIPR